MKICNLTLLFCLFPLVMLSQDYSHVYKFYVSDEASTSTSCGTIQNNEWVVSRNSCNYYSPEFIAGDLKVYGERVIDISIKISKSGNLNEQDFVWVFYFIDDKPSGSKTISGNSFEGEFHFTDSLMVPARSKYRIRVALVSDNENKFWKIKDGDIIFAQRAVEGEELIEDKNATNKVFSQKERGLAKLYWNALSEKSGNYFQIERSSNGVDYEFAGFVKETNATGDVARYSFIDAGSFKPQTWYRVKQVDNGGNANLFGKPVTVKF